MSQTPTCWCGNTSLVRFNDAYFRCAECETLVAAGDVRLDPAIKDDDADFYGRNYWFKHQEQDLGFANIETRARIDLPERCQHWLKTILRYKLPPARTLELGCAHGGFVAMLRSVGFDSTGLELSPAIVAFARRTFDVPMLQGPIEQQDIPPETFDLLAMMDVMEHLPDPLGTLGHCAKLLKPNAILAAQTPRYPQGKSYEELLATNDPFIEMLRADEHLYLFSEQSARQLFRRISLNYVAMEPAMFGCYDMFLFASPSPIKSLNDEAVETSLLGSARGRMTLCWLDMNRDRKKLQDTVAVIENDRTARLDDNQTLATQVDASKRRIVEIEADREKRLEQIETLTGHVDGLEKTLAEVQADRAKRLEQIETLTTRLDEAQKFIAEIQADRAKRLEQIDTLTAEIDGLRKFIIEIQADRAKRLEDIETLTADVGRLQSRIAEIETDREKRLELIVELSAQIKELHPPVA